MRCATTAATATTASTAGRPKGCFASAVENVANGSAPTSGALVVADFSRILAGPYTTMLLADMGAEVEGPSGDDTRTWTPPVREGVSTYYLGINRGKRSIVLDLRDEADVAAAREPARRADVVFENFKPGGMGRFGSADR